VVSARKEICPRCRQPKTQEAWNSGHNDARYGEKVRLRIG
jgi:hypothetical protein